MSETGKEDDQENKAVFAAIEGNGELIGTGGILVRMSGGSRGGEGQTSIFPTRRGLFGVRWLSDTVLVGQAPSRAQLAGTRISFH